MSIPLNADAFAESLKELLNNEDSRRECNLTADSNSPVAESTDFEYEIFADAGQYKGPSRLENTITRYINGELSVVASDLTGTEIGNSSAIIQTRLELIIPMLTDVESNNGLLNAVREHMSSRLRYASQKYVVYDSQVYLQIIEFNIPNTGMRDQIAGVGDAITLSMYITFSFIMSGIASTGIEVYLVKDGDEETLIPYSKLGITRKLVSESNVESGNVESGNETYVPVTKNLPSSSVLTINMDLLARFTPFDAAMRKFRLDGTVETLTIIVKEIYEHKIDEHNNGVSKYEEKKYSMMLDLAAFNAEVDAVCSTTVTLVERR